MQIFHLKTGYILLVVSRFQITCTSGLVEHVTSCDVLNTNCDNRNLPSSANKYEYSLKLHIDHSTVMAKQPTEDPIKKNKKQLPLQIKFTD